MAAAVELDHHLLVWPGGVHAIAGDDDIELRCLDVPIAAEVEESVLERGLGIGRLFAELRERRTESFRAAPPAAPSKQFLHRPHVEERNRCACSIARTSWRRLATAAKSSSVRGTLVTGMPSLVVQSASVSWRVRCTITPSTFGFLRLGTVTWIAGLDVPMRPHWSTAVRLLSAAPFPHARTAAVRKPSRPMSRC